MVSTSLTQYYYTGLLTDSFQNVAFYPLNFIIPSPYPYIIDPSISQISPSLPPAQLILKQEPQQDESYTAVIQPKKEEPSSEENKIYKLERETPSSLLKKKQ